MGSGKNAYLQREEDKRKAWVKMAERVTEPGLCNCGRYEKVYK